MKSRTRSATTSVEVPFDTPTGDQDLYTAEVVTTWDDRDRDSIDHVVTVRSVERADGTVEAVAGLPDALRAVLERDAIADVMDRAADAHDRDDRD